MLYRLATLSLVAALFVGCYKPAPTAAEIAQANADLQKHEAQIARIKKFSTKSETDVKKWEKIYNTGDIAEWAKLRPFEQAMVCVFPFVGETDDDQVLCIAASNEARINYEAWKANGEISGVPAKQMLGLNPSAQIEQAKRFVQLIKLGSIDAADKDMIMLSDAMRPKP